MKMCQSYKNLIFAVIAVCVNLTFGSISFAQALLDGEVLHMEFNEGSDNTVIDWIGSNDGEIKGSANWVDGRYNGGLYLDGATYVTVPNEDPLTQLSRPMTVAAWVKPNEFIGYRNLVEMDGPSGWKVGFKDNHIVWTQYLMQNFVGGTTVNRGQWTHVAVTWDGAQARIYVNGEEDSKSPIGSSSAGLNGNVYQLGAGHIYAVSEKGVSLNNIEAAIGEGISPVLTSVYKTIDFPNTGGEFKHRDGTTTGISDYFYVKYTGYIWIPESGNYQFHVKSDDGFRLKIDGEMVIEHQAPRGYDETSGGKKLDPGMHSIELSYFEWTDGAGLWLGWTPPGGSEDLIPSTHLTQSFIDVSDTVDVPSLDIGYRRTTNASYFKGSVDDLWIFSDVKTPTEIRQIMNKPDPVFTNIKGPNGKFNVAVDSNVEVTFVVDVTYPVDIPVDITDYYWAKTVGSDLPVTADYEKGTTNTRNFDFDNPGGYTVYCRVIDSNGMESDLIRIPVYAWNRPTVSDAPPEPGMVSWYNGKYVGVAGELTKLQAAATKGSDESDEEISKFIWDFNNNWDTIELEQQSAEQIATYT